jgi:hypothetical protein
VTDLADFLRARLDETAEQADQLHTVSCSIHPQGLEQTWCDCDYPARVLADVEAKRRIIELHRVLREPISDDDVLVCCTCEDRQDHHAAYWPCQTLRLLAVSYADHPDYRDEWRP